MDAHHYLGALPKIGETLWYAAIRRGDAVALAGFSAAALKCAARDRWIGWDFRTQYDRQHLLANNSRFLVLPGGRVPNLGSRVLALCARRLRPRPGRTQAGLRPPPGSRRAGALDAPPAARRARHRRRRHPVRRARLQGHGRVRRRPVPDAVSERFRCRHRGGDYQVPSQFVVGDVLVRVDPDQLDRALQRFHADHGADDDAIAIDGKTMCNAVQADEEAAASRRTECGESAGRVSGMGGVAGLRRGR